MKSPQIELSVQPDPGALSRMRFFLTDGLGGYSLTTPAQTRTSGIQGLLATQLDPAGPNMLLLARVDEALLFDGGARAELNTHHYRTATTPDGYERVVTVGFHPFPTTRFQAGDRLLERTVFTLPGHRAVGLRYTLLEGPEMGLELRPQLAFRDIFSLTSAHEGLDDRIETRGEISILRPYSGLPPLFWGTAPGSRLEPPGHWYFRIRYPEDQEAGLPDEEDLWNPGRAVVPLQAGRPVTVVAGLEPQFASDPEAMWQQALDYREQLVTRAGTLGMDPIGQALLWAADAFLVRRGGGWAVAAGYPSGEEQLTEAMIALPGLTLVTGRHEEARAILTRAVSRLGELEPGAVGIAWFLYALDRYHRATGDRGLLDEVWPAVRGRLEPLGWQAPSRLDEERHALDAVWANGWSAAAQLADARQETEAARDFSARAGRIRRYYRTLTEPTEGGWSRARILSLSLPYPLYAGPAGWERAAGLQGGARRELPPGLAGQAAIALLRQRQATASEMLGWLEPHIDRLMGEGLGQLWRSDGGGRRDPVRAVEVADLALAYASAPVQQGEVEG